MKDKPTIRDIAQLAGVSTATVSRVLNHNPVVDPLTRERVLRVIEEQGFVPDLSAVQLANQFSGRKREILPPFPADFLWGAATSAYQIEGATHEDGRADCIWDTFAREPGATVRGETADEAADNEALQSPEKTKLCRSSPLCGSKPAILTPGPLVSLKQWQKHCSKLMFC